MFRPVTALSILFFAAFALLMLSVLSTPIIEPIAIARFGGVQFGVFGYCTNGQGCSDVQFGYDMGRWRGPAVAVSFEGFWSNFWCR